MGVNSLTIYIELYAESLARNGPMDDIMQPELLSRLCWDVATFPAAKLAMAKLRECSVMRFNGSRDAIDGRHYC